jgi:predicted alpha/beta hydrolase family esterase
MKQQVFYIHGGGSYSRDEDYVYDLKNEPLRSPSNEAERNRWDKHLRISLGETFEVFTPKMPNSSNAVYRDWSIWFERHFEYLRDDVILVGWSLGASFLARYLTENEVPFAVKAVLLLAGPFDRFVCEGTREDGGDFYPDPEKVKDLQSIAEKIYILHSKDDFVVPYEHALKYKEALPEAELITFEDKNHFLVEELPELAGLIKNCK